MKGDVKLRFLINNNLASVGFSMIDRGVNLDLSLAGFSVCLRFGMHARTRLNVAPNISCELIIKIMSFLNFFFAMFGN
jgi:hypothetical protein